MRRKGLTLSLGGFALVSMEVYCWSVKVNYQREKHYNHSDCKRHMRNSGPPSSAQWGLTGRDFTWVTVTLSQRVIINQSLFSPWRRDFILLGVFLFQAACLLLFPLLHFLLLVFDRLLKGEQTRFFSTTEPVTAEHRVARSIAINRGFRVSAGSRLQRLCGNASHRFH